MWQKCPICDGSGTVYTPASSNLTSISTGGGTCPVCNGRRIISSLNGLPPSLMPAEVFFNEKGLNKGSDFRDANMESQQEYFGKK